MLRPTRMLGWLLFAATFATLAEGAIKYPPMMTKQPPSTEELLFQVASRQDENDKPFIIECEAEGEPAPKYRWIKNGKEFDWQTYDDRISQQPGRGTLVITSPRDEDLGQYQCFATNELGTATSNSVFVRKSELNSFKNEDPITESINEGDPIGLFCQPPDGYPKPYVYWMIQDDRGALRSINSSRMTVDPEGTLWFTNVTRHDESNDFTYACSATSTFRNEYKLGNRVYMKVFQTGSTSIQTRNEPKQQYVSRKNTIVLKGRTLRLWCLFSGTPLPEMKWKKKDGILPMERLDYENYGKTLVIKYVDFEDAGQYECEASNGVGVAKSYTMNVDVQAIPYFTVEPEVENKAEGETAEFFCHANGVPPPKQFWIYNGMPIETAPPNPRRIVDSSGKITIYNMTKGDTGNYGCNATNEHGYVYKDVYVNVLALPPEIRTPPAQLQAVDGQEINMTCRVFGAPKPRITWIRDGLELTGGRFQVADTGDLVIKDVTFTDSGDYTCYAENKFGKQEANGNLVVKERTRITDRPMDYEVAAGQTATFRCNAVTDPDLVLTISWLTDGKQIDFEQEPRFVQQTDFSLSITKTTELDSGIYTCVASSDLDEVTATASLIVQDIPNPPRLLNVACNDRDAGVEWQAMGDNRAPILVYAIQYNTSFTPDTWENAFESVPASNTQFTVNLSPWSNYTFRVIARNKIGPSLPSEHSHVCTTPYDVPYKNPDGVEGRGSTPHNLIIKWSPMSEIDHNGPGFKYRVYYRRDDVENSRWNTDNVVDWQQDHYVVANQPTFRPYRLKVEAHNDRGQANVAAQEVLGWSGEDTPTEPPRNLTLIDLRDATTAHLAWNPVSNTSLRGHFKGYKIQTWIETESEDKARDIIVENNYEPSAVITSFVPYAKNFVRVLVFNGAYNGPPSEVISFVTPQGRPGPVDSLEAIPMGSSAFFLIWRKPKQPNGVLTGYHIYFQEVNGTNTGSESERDPPIRDPTVTRAKLASLKPGTKYRITLRARTAEGEGSRYYIERMTRANGASAPGKPSFIWQHISTKSGSSAIKITWIPNTEKNPGSHFFVQYKLYGESLFQDTKTELYSDFTVLRGLEPDQTYEVRLVAVDGEYSTASDVEEIDTYVTGILSGVTRRPAESIATRGWFIGMMLAIAFLLLILILVCIVKRNRGGKYAVHEREAAHGRTDFNEETSFPEYSQPLDGKRDSLGSDRKEPVESDADSMAEYGDGETGRFTEDGSFIGQYGTGKKKGGGGHEAISPSVGRSNMATFV